MSDVSDLYDNLKTQMIEKSRKQETRYHIILENQQAYCQTILDSLKQLTEHQQKAKKTTSKACTPMWIPVSVQRNLTLMNKIRIC